MATKIMKEYTLEQLTPDSVNVLIVSSATVNLKVYVLGHERISYSNSEHGREQVRENLPEEYSNAVFALWGDTPTVPDP